MERNRQVNKNGSLGHVYRYNVYVIMTLPLTKFSMPSMIFSVTLRQLGVPLNPPAGHFSRLSISVALPIHPYKYCMICVISQIYFRLFHSKSTNFMKIVFGTNENWGFHAGHTLRLCLLTKLSLISESRSYMLRNLSNAHYPMGSQGFELSPAE